MLESIRSLPQNEISLPQLQQQILNEFRLNIPQGALKSILKRAQRKRFLQKHSGIYVKNNTKLHSSFLPNRGDVLRRQEALITLLISFCKTNYDVSWTQEQAEAALLSFIQNESMPILAGVLQERPIQIEIPSVDHADFLVTKFLLKIERDDPHAFTYLETLVKGSMLANVLLYPDISRVTQRFGKVHVIFDTNFLLRALGLAGEGLEAPCKELIDMLKQFNVKLYCFEHTLEEIENILSSAFYVLRDSAYATTSTGETLEYFISIGAGPSDVEFVRARLDKLLRTIDVHIIPTPKYKPAFGINEHKFEAILKEQIRYRTDKAILFDIKSLSAIHRIRKGRSPQQLETCDAIFVTTNTSLVIASKTFFDEECETTPFIPHCISDYVLTTLIWLKNPIKAPDLPRKQIIADCYAGLNPPDTLWRRYLEKTNELRNKDDITQDDYYILRFSMEARHALMETTLGDADIFSEGTIHQVLEKAREAVRADAQDRFLKEKASRVTAEQKAEFTEGKITRFSETLARRVITIILYGATSLFALGVFLSLPEPLYEIRENWKPLITPIILVLLFVSSILTILNVGFGFTIRAFLKSFERQLVTFIEQQFFGKDKV